MNDFLNDKSSKPKQDKVITYFVNAEKFETTDKKLTVRYILINASFIPVEDYRFFRDDGNKEYENYDEELPVHNGESFTAIFKGVTPVSEV